MDTSCSRLTEPDVPTSAGILIYDAVMQPHAILMAAAHRLRARGVTVGGLLQRRGERLSSGKRGMWLDDIATGATIRLDEPRGAGATACVLDTDALARGACLLRRDIDAGLSVLLVSRFGALEAEGAGLRPEIAEAICSGAIVVIPVRCSRVRDLEAFLGFVPTELPASANGIADWAESRLTAPVKAWACLDGQ